MRRHEKLLAELATALRAKSEAKKIWADKRADALEARGEYNEKIKLVEEIQTEIETGSSGRPLLDEIAAKAEPPRDPPPPPDKPKPTPPDKPRPAASASSGRTAKKKARAEDRGPKLAGVEFPSTREILDELAQEANGKTDGSGGAAAPDAGDSKPAPSTGSGQAASYREQKPGEKPFWTSGDLDLELMHAVFYGNQDWVDFRRAGATNEQILERLASRWPVFRLSVDAQDSGGNFGYTIACPGGEPAIWVGPYLGSHHKPSANGSGLAERVRRLLELPTPSASASSGQAKREPTISANQNWSTNGTGFTTPAVLQPPPEPSPEDKKPIRRQSGRGPR